jgi:hypothetical protein
VLGQGKGGGGGGEEGVEVQRLFVNRVLLYLGLLKEKGICYAIGVY